MAEPIRAATTKLSHCPVCDSGEIAQLQPTVDFASFTTSGTEFVFPIGVGGCRSCGFIFLNPRATLDSLIQYYGRQSRGPRDLSKQDLPFADLLDKQAGFILKHWRPTSKRQRVLDVGCAEGHFLRRLGAECHLGVDLEGVEPGAVYAATAREMVPGVVIHEKTIETCELAEESYDLITLRHVFEHLLEPVEALKIMRPLLSDGGLLHIELPDVRDIDPTISPFFHHEHINYFTPDTLRFALESNGFDVVDLESAQDNPVGSGFSYPVSRVLAKRSSNASSANKAPRSDVDRIYGDYLARQEQFFATTIAPVRLRIQELRSSGKRIGVFGAGPHTMDLFFALQGEAHHFAVAFDNNPLKSGKTIRGLPIVAPTASSLGEVDAVVISSSEFEPAMVEQIKGFDLPGLEVIPLYSRP